MSDKKWRVAGINFDHMHMGDNLRMAFEHPDVEIVGVCDEEPQRMADAAKNFGISEERVFTDYRKCMEEEKPDLVLLCPATAKHGEWTEKIAPYGASIIMEKPFAATLDEADRMVAAMGSGQRLAINWPLAWYPPHVTAKNLIDVGAIGDVTEVHFYDGNRGPLWHVADKVEKDEKWVRETRAASWFYRKEKGGGSLLDYLGYGTTLGTWYHDGKAPIEVTAVVDEPIGLEVDEHSVVVARYDVGLSKFETRWGTFTDPWTHQPQPKCGFVIVGTEGTIANYDYEERVSIQTRKHPEARVVGVETLEAPNRNPIEYVLDCIERDAPIEGPLSPALSRIGQQIVDTAYQSAVQKATLPLMG